MEEYLIPEKYKIIRLLGKGKSGNSYLVNCCGKEFILKEMHSEEVFYYNFTKSKIELELDAYPVLKEQKINIPALVEYDMENSLLLKEYIKGETVAQLLKDNRVNDEMILEMLGWELSLKKNGLNIDYFPTNFVIDGSKIYYIDYEYNLYSVEWDFSNWGIYYWLNPEGFGRFIETGDPGHINIDGTGKPLIIEGAAEKREFLTGRFAETFP